MVIYIENADEKKEEKDRIEAGKWGLQKSPTEERSSTQPEKGNVIKAWRCRKRGWQWMKEEKGSTKISSSLEDSAVPVISLTSWFESCWVEWVSEFKNQQGSAGSGSGSGASFCVKNENEAVERRENAEKTRQWCGNRISNLMNVYWLRCRDGVDEVHLSDIKSQRTLASSTCCFLLLSFLFGTIYQRASTSTVILFDGQ